ncbi:MAG: NmrA family NAD(P)-binding protein [Alphaproteobacteria bacterium]|nr:NmrA family NAD(P)-binding protein [Alphaproteobacteria bacterium]
MPRKPNILITSAGGKTGLQTALQLLQNGYAVRAFLRRNDQRATRLKEAGAEIFIGDQYSVRDMRQAMAGVQRAYHCAPTAPNGLHFGAVFAAAAFEAGIEHVVSLSQWLSQPEHPSQFTREVWLNDTMLEMLPDASVTTVNVGWFADNYFMVLEPAAQLGLLPMPLGDGAEKKNAPPSNEDIAAVAAGALMDPAAHAGKVYRPTGPKLLSPNEIAETLGKVMGRTVRYQDISEAMFQKALSAVPPPNYSDAMLTQLTFYVEEYRRGTFAVNAPTDAVEQVAGRPAEDFETIARRVVAERPDAVRPQAAACGLWRISSKSPSPAAPMLRPSNIGAAMC